MTASSNPAPSRPPDPRIEHTRRLVMRVALEELAAAGYGALTIEGVARRSGVAKSTIYRHWPGRIALVTDALETLNVQPPAAPVLDGAGARGRVEQLLRHLAEAFRDPTITGCTPALIEASEHDPAVRDFHHAYAARRRQALVDALSDGVSSGELPRRIDPETAAVALAGAVVYRRLMTGTPFAPDDVPALVETVLGTAG